MDGENIVISVQKDIFYLLIFEVYGNILRFFLVLNMMIVEYLIDCFEVLEVVDNFVFVNMMLVVDLLFDYEKC